MPFHSPKIRHTVKSDQCKWQYSLNDTLSFQERPSRKACTHLWMKELCCVFLLPSGRFRNSRQSILLQQTSETCFASSIMIAQFYVPCKTSAVLEFCKSFKIKQVFQVGKQLKTIQIAIARNFFLSPILKLLNFTTAQLMNLSSGSKHSPCIPCSMLQKKKKNQHSCKKFSA